MTDAQRHQVLQDTIETLERFVPVGVDVLIVVGMRDDDGDVHCGLSLPEDRELAVRMVKTAEVELAKQVGLLSDD